MALLSWLAAIPVGIFIGTNWSGCCYTMVCAGVVTGAATADVSGRGSDFTSRSANLRAEAYVQNLRYQHADLSDISMQASLRNGKGTLDLGCLHNPCY